MAIILQEYERLKFLGKGAFAKIYKVRHKDLGYVRAIKVLTDEIDEGGDDKVYETFLKECSLLLRVGNGGHPNIIRIYQPRKIDGQALVEMDYIDGCTLDEYIKQHDRFVPYKEVLRFIKEIGSALAYCHVDCYRYMMEPDDRGKSEEELIRKYGVAHNDLHSNNIMCKSLDGSFVLLDFGLAIQDNQAVKSSSRRDGAAEYMPPEKWTGDPVLNDKAVDVYGFGILMYEMLAGDVPFKLDYARYRNDSLRCLNAVRSMHERETPAPIEPIRRERYEALYPGETYARDYPDWLDGVVMKCLEKKPEDRYHDAKELYLDILNHLAEDEREAETTNDGQKDEVFAAVARAKEAEQAAKVARAEAEAVRAEAAARIAEAERGARTAPVPNPPGGNKIWKWILIVFLGLLAVGVFFLLYPRLKGGREFTCESYKVNKTDGDTLKVIIKGKPLNRLYDDFINDGGGGIKLSTFGGMQEVSPDSIIFCFNSADELEFHIPVGHQYMPKYGRNKVSIRWNGGGCEADYSFDISEDQIKEKGFKMLNTYNSRKIKTYCIGHNGDECVYDVAGDVATYDSTAVYFECYGGAAGKGLTIFKYSKAVDQYFVVYMQRSKLVYPILAIGTGTKGASFYGFYSDADTYISYKDDPNNKILGKIEHFLGVDVSDTLQVMKSINNFIDLQKKLAEASTAENPAMSNSAHVSFENMKMEYAFRSFIKSDDKISY